MLDFLSGISTFILTLAAGAVRLRNRALSTGLSRSATHPLVISTIVLPTVLGTILQLFNVREVGSFALSIALSGVVFLSWPIIVDIIRHVNSRRSDALLLAGISTVFGVLGGAEFLSIGGQTLPAVWLSSLAPYLKPDLLVIGGLGLIGTLAGASAGGDRGAAWGWLIGSAFGVVIVTNLILLGTAHYWLVFEPDSPSYLSLNACRSPGYYLATAPFHALDARWLVAAQLNLMLTALIAVVLAVAWTTESPLAGTVCLLLGVILGNPLAYCYALLSESLFVATFGVLVAGTIAYMRSPSTWLAVVIGIAAGLCLALKAPGPALLVPTMLLVLRPALRPRLNGFLIAAIPLSFFTALVINGHQRNGSWSPTNFGGFALVGHVAQYIRNDVSSSDPGLSALVAAKVRPIIEAWPSQIWVNAYLTATRQSYNPMLYAELWPAVAGQLKPNQRNPCLAPVNEMLMALSREAILRYPVRFAGHVLIQYYGLWSYALRPGKWEKAATEARLNVGKEFETNPRNFPPFVPTAWRPSDEMVNKVHAEAAQYVRIATYLHDIRIALSPFRFLSLLLGLAATLAVPMLVLLRRLDKASAATVATAALVCAYLGAQALFQPALPRYTEAAQFGIVAFVSLVFHHLKEGLLSSKPPAMSGQDRLAGL